MTNDGQSQQLAPESNKLDEAEAGEKLSPPADKRRTCSPTKWLLCLLMGLCTLAAALVLAYLLLVPRPAPPQDLCSPDGPAPERDYYRNFATKTLYATARQQLVGADAQVAPKPEGLPAFFADRSLAAVHQDLLARKCQPRQIHLYARHAARYPSGESIARINAGIRSVVERLPGKLAPLEVTPAEADQPKIDKLADASGRVCPDHFAKYRQWAEFMQPDDDDRLLASGFRESHELAQRLKSLYPDLFGSKSNVSFAVTSAVRTSETAAPFMAAAGRAPDECSGIDFTAGRQMAAVDKCFAKIAGSYSNDALLSFHKECDKQRTRMANTSYGFKDASHLKPIAQMISAKLALKSGADQIKPDDVEVIYNVCKYETAFRGSSIWCNLFTDDQLKFMEYRQDVDDYLNNAFGSPNLYKTACPLTTDLNLQLRTLIEQSIETKAAFHFTHSEVIQKLFANLVSLGNDPAFAVDTVRKSMKETKAPKTRQFQASLISPFSANILFSVYSCENPAHFHTQGSRIFVVSVNERPIKVFGGDHSAIELGLNKMLFDNKLALDRCEPDQFEEICRVSEIFE